MIAESEYKELMRLTEQIRKEEADTEEKWRMVETVRSRLTILQAQTREQITELESLEQAIGTILESL